MKNAKHVFSAFMASSHIKKPHGLFVGVCLSRIHHILVQLLFVLLAVSTKWRLA